MTQRVGLIGYPVEHSLSPAIHQAAFDTLGLDARFELWPTPESEVAERIDGLRRPGYLGASVTLPHKGVAFDLVDDTTERARAARAVNTIVNRGGRLLGDNTDIPGFLAPLEQRGIDLTQTRAVVLGAGGAARGVVVALLSAGCRQISVGNRTPERARAMVGMLQAPVPIWYGPIDAALVEWLEGATLLVNATAVGWEGDALPLPPAMLETLPREALVYDLTYRDTPLLQAARRLGLETQDGLEMLVQQGVAAFRLWTGQEPPVEVMRAAAIAARDGRA
ncbi:MAG: shikimate dehydrogenase [Sphaerobacter sp.]|nr:shikimate dehydrogenase [Sphaerobacter sp.]